MSFPAEWPFTFGGDEDDSLAIEHGALLAALEPALDPAEGTLHEVEAYAEARVLSLIWDAGERLANQADPDRMLEALPDWEEILGIVPVVGSTDVERRAAVGAKLHGLAGNDLINIAAAVKKLLGQNYEALVTVDPSKVVAYWPGGVPGPPGYEWWSNNAAIAIRVNLIGLNNTDGQRKGAQLLNMLDALLPVWMTFEVGTGSDGFLAGQDIVGLDFL